MYDVVWLDDGLRIRQEGRLGDHGLRHAEGPALARVGVPPCAHGAALDLSTELDEANTSAAQIRKTAPRQATPVLATSVVRPRTMRVGAHYDSDDDNAGVATGDDAGDGEESDAIDGGGDPIEGGGAACDVCE